MRRLAVLVVGAVLILTAIAWARPADRDPAFSADGYAEFSAGDGAFNDVVALPGGDLVAVGRSQGIATVPQDPVIAARYRPDGELRSPVVRLPSGLDAEGASVAVDSEGRVVVAIEDGNGRVYLMRLLGDTLGPDPAWRGGSSSIAAVDADAAQVVGLGVTPDDRPVVVATHEDNGSRTAVLRWTEAGVLDSTFGTSGRIDLGSATAPVTASDMLVDAAGRVVIARGTNAGRNLLRITDSLPGTTIAVPDAVETGGMQVALAGTDLLVGGAIGVSGNIDVRVARFTDAGAADATFGIRTATVAPGYTTSTPGPSDMTVLADGRIVTVLALKDGGVQRSALVRLNADGTPDGTFAAGGGGHFAVDNLGNNDRNLEPNALAAVSDGKVVVAGTSGTDPSERAYVARYGAPGLPPEVSLSAAYRPIGDPPSVRAYARPGQPVDLTATASDPDGTISGYAWDPEGDGTFTDNAASPTFSASFPLPRVYTATVRARDADGLTETAFVEVRVQANQTPALAIRRGYDADPGGSPSSFRWDPLESTCRHASLSIL